MSLLALDRHANNASALSRTDPKRQRHALRRAVGRVLPGERVASCGQKAVGAFVTLHRHQGGTHFGGIETCSSVWACPVCAVRISEGRRAEIDALLARHQDAGGDAFMATLTLPHHRFQSCRALRRGVSAAFRTVKTGRPWQRARDAHGWLGDIRALEVTHGGNGWHPHLHVLIFFQSDTPDLLKDGFGVWLFDAWSKAVEKLGFGRCSERAFTWERVTANGGAAEYIGKWGAALELTKAHTKRARGGRTPWQILSDFQETGSCEDAELFREYAMAFKGARQLTYSRGLRDHYAAGPETSDEAFAAPPQAPETHTATITRDLFRVIATKGITADVLLAHQTAGVGGVLGCFSALGIPWHLDVVSGLERGRLVPLLSLGRPLGVSSGSPGGQLPFPANALIFQEGELPSP